MLAYDFPAKYPFSGCPSFVQPIINATFHRSPPPPNQGPFEEDLRHPGPAGLWLTLSPASGCIAGDAGVAGRRSGTPCTAIQHPGVAVQPSAELRFSPATAYIAACDLSIFGRVAREGLPGFQKVIGLFLKVEGALPWRGQ